MNSHPQHPCKNASHAVYAYNAALGVRQVGDRHISEDCWPASLVEMAYMRNPISKTKMDMKRRHPMSTSDSYIYVWVCIPTRAHT